MVKPFAASFTSRVLERPFRSTPFSMGHPLGFDYLDGIQAVAAQGRRPHPVERGGDHRHGGQNNAGNMFKMKFEPKECRFKVKS
jgi:hypothetical protein